jgi:hypothetical protein
LQGWSSSNPAIIIVCHSWQFLVDLGEIRSLFWHKCEAETYKLIFSLAGKDSIQIRKWLQLALHFIFSLITLAQYGLKSTTQMLFPKALTTTK